MIENEEKIQLKRLELQSETSNEEIIIHIKNEILQLSVCVIDILNNSIYVILSELSQSLTYMISLIFIGNIYNDTLMINTFGIIHFVIYNFIINFSVQIITSSFELEARKEYLSKNLLQLNIIYVKSIGIGLIFGLFLSIFLFIFLVFISEYLIFDIFKQGYIKEFLYIGIFYPVLHILLSISLKFLYIHENVLIFSFFLMNKVLVFIIFNYIFIYKLHIGLKGLALSFVFTNSLTLTVVFIYNSYQYISFPNMIMTLICPSTYLNVYNFLYKSFTYSVFYYFSSLSFDILIILPYLIDTLNSTTFLILYSIYKVLLSFTEGLAHSCHVLTNFSLYNNNPEATKAYFVYSILVNSLITKLFSFITFILVSYNISYSIIYDSLIANEISKSEHCFCLALILHSISKLFVSYFLCSQSRLLFILTYLIHAFLFNFPISLCLCYYFQLGTIGIFLSLSFSYLVLFAFLVYYYSYCWDEEVVQNDLDLTLISCKV